jgi:hypothetical protein
MKVSKVSEKRIADGRKNDKKKKKKKKKKPTMKWLGSSTRVYQNGISDSWASRL